MDMRLVLVTHPSKEHAERITRGVIDAKLAACVLVTDVKSFYNWEGKLNEDDEVVTILKTSTDKVTDLEKYIETNHDYDVPAIISFQANANQAYGNWLNNNLLIKRKSLNYLQVLQNLRGELREYCIIIDLKLRSSLRKKPSFVHPLNLDNTIYPLISQIGGIY